MLAQRNPTLAHAYRRAFIPGGSFFFTLVTQGRKPIFATAEVVEVLRGAFRSVRKSRPFEIDAVVVMPDHLHCIWTLPPGDADFSTRWRLIKTGFTKHCDPALRPDPGRARKAKQEQAVWQHRYWEHMLRDETDFARHVDYIHYVRRESCIRYCLTLKEVVRLVVPSTVAYRCRRSWQRLSLKPSGQCKPL